MKVRDPLSLLFDWPVRHAVHLGLPVALFLSVIVHIGGLAAFGLRSTPSARLPGDVVVYWLDAARASGEILARKAEAADPSLFSGMAIEEECVDFLPAAAYVPDYKSWKPEFLAIPSFANDRPLPAMLEGPVVEAVPHLKLPAEAPAPPTRLIFAEDVRDRIVSLPPVDDTFSAPSKQSLLPAEFLIGISPSGSVLHAFLLSGSGYEPLDRTAQAALLSMSFTPAAIPNITWTTATFLWGSDIRRTRLSD